VFSQNFTGYLAWQAHVGVPNGGVIFTAAAPILSSPPNEGRHRIPARIKIPVLIDPIKKILIFYVII